MPIRLIKKIPRRGQALSSWKSVQKVSEQYFFDQNRWVYRGQRDSTWPLSTTIERALQASGIPLSEAWKIEGGLLRRFQRQAHHYNSSLPPAKNIPDWLSWMQHFGAPTRLLDWTHSFYVGLYFAIRELSQNGDDEAALWAVDWRWIETEIHGHDAAIFDADRNIQEFDNFRKLLGPGTSPGILKINGFQLNQRLVVQQGTFLSPKDITKTLEDNLKEALQMTGSFSGDHVVKIRISSKARKEIMERLIRMNVNEASLFPDLAGFASSLKHLLVFKEIFAPPEYWNKAV